MKFYKAQFVSNIFSVTQAATVPTGSSNSYLENSLNSHLNDTILRAKDRPVVWPLRSDPGSIGCLGASALSGWFAISLSLLVYPSASAGCPVTNCPHWTEFALFSKFSSVPTSSRNHLQDDSLNYQIFFFGTFCVSLYRFLFSVDLFFSAKLSLLHSPNLKVITYRESILYVLGEKVFEVLKE